MEELATLRDWLAEERPVALATVLSTWGSAPRPVGSQMLIDAAGNFSGSVSGGCVEAAIIQAAATVIATGQPRDLSYGVATEDAWAVGLPCGGTIRVYVEPVAASNLPVIAGALAGGRAIQRSVTLGVVEPWVFAPADSRVRQSQLREDVFQHLLAPAPRLIVVGAVHIAQSLLAMARLAGFTPLLVDPRPAFASAARFAGETVRVEWPDTALAALAPDEYTAIVTLSHDPKIDDPALIAALQSSAFYIAALGSRKTQAARRERLATAGFDAAAIARLHGPAGLAIGAITPAEIAVSILAELVASWRQSA